MLAICQEILNLVDALAIQDQNFQESKTGRGFWVGRMGSFSLVNQSDNNQSWVLVGSCGVIERVSYLVETGRKSKIGRKKEFTLPTCVKCYERLQIGPVCHKTYFYQLMFWKIFGTK